MATKSTPLSQLNNNSQSNNDSKLVNEILAEIGNEQNEKSIKYMAEKIKDLTNSKSNIVFTDPKALHGDLFAEAPEKIPNSEKIKSRLGWSPTKNADEVISEVVDFYKQDDLFKKF